MLVCVACLMPWSPVLVLDLKNDFVSDSAFARVVKVTSANRAKVSYIYTGVDTV